MNNVVKNTTKMWLIDVICPHTCRGCGHLGSVLCECCKKYFFERREAVCPLCRTNVSKKSQNMLCSECRSEANLEHFWLAGWREGVLDQLIKDYKYRAVRAIGAVLAEILDEIVPRELDDADMHNVVLVPLPTIGKHIRERGFDHTLKLAKCLAKRRGWRVESVLARATDTVQVGAKMAERQKQAKSTYVVVKKANENTHYILLDDIWTTGASMKAAADLMRAAGAQHISGLVVAVSHG